MVNRALGVSRWFMDTGGQLVGGGTLGGQSVVDGH